MSEPRKMEDTPWWEIKRCETNIVVGELSECGFCGAANGETCRRGQMLWRTVGKRP